MVPVVKCSFAYTKFKVNNSQSFSVLVMKTTNKFQGIEEFIIENKLKM